MRTLTLVVVLATIACGTDRDRDQSRRPVYDDVPYQAEIEESLGAVDLKLSAEQRARLDQAG